jgi:hypothetical protein
MVEAIDASSISSLGGISSGDVENASFTEESS